MQARTGGLNEVRIAPHSVLRGFLKRCRMDYKLPRQVRVLGMGLILLIGASTLASAPQAQTATVIGTITSQNNRPVTNVLVSIAGKYRYTDVGGRYRIDGVPFGRYKMQVASGGKVLREVEVDIHDAMSVINLKLP